MSRPLGSDPTSRQQGLHSYCGPVRRRTPHRYSVPTVSASARSLSRPGGPNRPGNGRHIGARLLTFRARAADQAHAASTPGTTWPIHGHPPGSSRGARKDPRFRYRPNFSTLQQRRPAGSPSRTLLVRLPGPHLTHLVRLFPDAHHDGLRPTQLRVV
jgi:hypothetical protein